jgi:RNA polymerase sigma-70 factor (ECF subfamily)
VTDPDWRPLVEAAAKGDRPAAERLLRALLPRVRNLVRYLMSGDSEVNDVAQDSLVAVLRGLPSYRGDGRFESWVDRIVARTIFAALRKRRALRVVPATESAEQVEDPAGGPGDYLERRRLVEMLDGLPEKQRSAVVLHFVLGMSVPEIAAELDAPEETVRSRLRLGMEQLRERMEVTERAHVVGK